MRYPDDDILHYLENISRKYSFPFNASDEQTRQKFRQVHFGDHRRAFRAVQSLMADGWFECPINSFIKQYSRHNEKVLSNGS